MSLFDPAAILSGLIARLGITPEQLQGAYTLVVQELQAMRAHRQYELAEIAAFKTAAVQANAAILARLDRIEAALCGNTGTQAPDHINGHEAAGPGILLPPPTQETQT